MGKTDEMILGVIIGLTLLGAASHLVDAFMPALHESLRMFSLTITELPTITELAAPPEPGEGDRFPAPPPEDGPVIGSVLFELLRVTIGLLSALLGPFLFPAVVFYTFMTLMSGVDSLLSPAPSPRTSAYRTSDPTFNTDTEDEDEDEQDDEPPTRPAWGNPSTLDSIDTDDEDAEQDDAEGDYEPSMTPWVDPTALDSAGVDVATAPEIDPERAEPMDPEDALEYYQERYSDGDISRPEYEDRIETLLERMGPDDEIDPDACPIEYELDKGRDS